MPTLGRLIRRRRIELGLTQEQLAERVGGSMRQAEVSRLENDRVLLPRRERLERIAEVLEVPLGELLVRSGWTGADSALSETASPPPRPVTVFTAMELLDEIRGLVEETQLLLLHDQAEHSINREGDAAKPDTSDGQAAAIE